MPTTANLELAQRVVKVIEEHGHPSQSDALALRLWAGPHGGLHPLKDIAQAFIEAERVYWVEAPERDQ